MPNIKVWSANHRQLQLQLLCPTALQSALNALSRMLNVREFFSICRRDQRKRPCSGVSQLHFSGHSCKQSEAVSTTCCWSRHSQQLRSLLALWTHLYTRGGMHNGGVSTRFRLQRQQMLQPQATAWLLLPCRCHKHDEAE